MLHKCLRWIEMNQIEAMHEDFRAIEIQLEN